MEAGAGVRFDFSGSLLLARRLWALSEQIETLMTNRATLAADALATWLGVYGTEFAGRVETEATDIARIAGELQTAAYGWASCWQQAMDQQNRILHAREVERVEDDRSVAASIWGGVVGHDDLPDQPAPVRRPSAPGFAATATLVRY